MSLLAFAVRLCAVKALTGATSAGARVYDSAVSPLDLRGDDAQPTITVATDEGSATPTGRDLLDANHKIELIVEIACANSVTFPIPAEEGGGEEEVVMVPHTDDGLELVLDLMGRQVWRAFLVGKIEAGWSDLLRTFVRNFERVGTRRGAGSEKGVRFAAHQIIFSCNTIAEPGFGEPVGPWERLLTLMRNDPDPSLGKVADLIEIEIKTPDLPSWRRAAADLGLRDYGASKIGIGPSMEDAEGYEDAEPATVIEFVEPGGTFTVDEATIADALPPEESDEGTG